MGTITMDHHSDNDATVTEKNIGRVRDILSLPRLPPEINDSIRFIGSDGQVHQGKVVVKLDVMSFLVETDSTDLFLFEDRRKNSKRIHFACRRSELNKHLKAAKLNSAIPGQS